MKIYRCTLYNSINYLRKCQNFPHSHTHTRLNAFLIWIIFSIWIWNWINKWVKKCIFREIIIVAINKLNGTFRRNMKQIIILIDTLIVLNGNHSNIFNTLLYCQRIPYHKNQLAHHAFDQKTIENQWIIKIILLLHDFEYKRKKYYNSN